MELKNRPININISTLTIVKILLIVLLLYFLFLIKDVVVILFVSLILASALDPWVDWLQKKKIPRSASVAFIYLIAISIIGSILFLLIPPISQEFGQLASNFPQYFEKIMSGFSNLKEFSTRYGFYDNIKSSLEALSSSLQGAATGVFSTVAGFIGGIMSFFLIMVLTFYMVVEENAIKKLIWSIAPTKHQPYIMHLINRMQQKIGFWLRGQLILSLVVFVFVYAGLSILGVEYALVLALMAFILEMVPYIGPTLAAIPAVLLALTQSPMLALFVAIYYYITQQIENNILVPKIMQKAVGLNPIVSISVLLIGFKLAGILGAMLSIPVATAVNVFIQDLFIKKDSSVHFDE